MARFHDCKVTKAEWTFIKGNGRHGGTDWEWMMTTDFKSWHKSWTELDKLSQLSNGLSSVVKLTKTASPYVIWHHKIWHFCCIVDNLLQRLKNWLVPSQTCARINIKWCMVTGLCSYGLQFVAYLIAEDQHLASDEFPYLAFLTCRKDCEFLDLCYRL